MTAVRGVVEQRWTNLQRKRWKKLLKRNAPKEPDKVNEICKGFTLHNTLNVTGCDVFSQWRRENATNEEQRPGREGSCQHQRPLEEEKWPVQRYVLHCYIEPKARQTRLGTRVPLTLTTVLENCMPPLEPGDTICVLPDRGNVGEFQEDVPPQSFQVKAAGNSYRLNHKDLISLSESLKGQIPQKETHKTMWVEWLTHTRAAVNHDHLNGKIPVEWIPEQWTIWTQKGEMWHGSLHVWCHCITSHCHVSPVSSWNETYIDHNGILHWSSTECLGPVRASDSGTETISIMHPCAREEVFSIKGAKTQRPAATCSCTSNTTFAPLWARFSLVWVIAMSHLHYRTILLAPYQLRQLLQCM